MWPTGFGLDMPANVDHCHQSSGPVWISVSHGMGGLGVWDRGQAETLTMSSAGNDKVMDCPQVDILVITTHDNPPNHEKQTHCQ